MSGRNMEGVWDNFRTLSIYNQAQTNEIQERSVEMPIRNKSNSYRSLRILEEHFFSDILIRGSLEQLFEFSKHHSILGYVWDILQPELAKLSPESMAQNRRLMLRWYATVTKIEEKNKQLNELCDKVEKKFQSAGFETMILKGQSLAPLYDEPLHRSPGDIDIWLIKEDKLSRNRNTIVKYVRRIKPKSKIYYHHMEFPSIKGIEVEAHFTPSWMANPYHNRKLQKFFIQEGRGARIQEFNEVFIPLHIFRHLFQEGITLKQVLDYYYVLKNRTTGCEEVSTAPDMLKRIGLKKFIEALCWVEQEVFGLQKQYMPFEPNEEEGHFLLQEIIGKNYHSADSNSDLTISDFASDNHLHNFASRIKRVCTLVKHYPDEALWELPWRIWQFLWRHYKGYA